MARCGRWRRTATNLYVPAGIDNGLPEQRIMEEAARLPDDGAVTGWAALLLHGGNFFDGLDRDGRTPLPVQLALPMARNLRPKPGVVLLRSPLPQDEIVVRHGIPCARPGRALFDLMAISRDFREAAVHASVACSAALLSIDEFRTYVRSRRCIAGIEKVRRSLPYVSDRVRSPKEAVLLQIWMIDAELPHPRMNWPIYDLDGRWIGSPDVLSDELATYGEYEGRGHEDEDVQVIDAARDTLFHELGLTGFRAASADLRFPATQLVDRMHATVRRAARAQLPRKWKLAIDPPPLCQPPPCQPPSTY